MPCFIPLMRCIGRAVVKNGGKAFANLVPFGEVAYEIAKDAYEDYRRDHTEAELRGDLQRLAQVDARQIAAEVASEVSAGKTAEVRQAIVAYLTQIPSCVRQSLRRPSDPSGTTVPAGRALKRPEDLLPFLPAGLPRFKPGDRPLAADWELVEMLGKGGFGEVWKARHLTRSRQKPVALKFCLDPVAADTLRNEAALLDHLDRVREEASLPGIVPLLETYLRADPPCLMYELIEGGDLAGLIQEMKERGGLTTEFANSVVHGLASILSPAHTHGLVHRDLKPSNILVQRGEGNKFHLFVADFGIGGLAAGRAIQEQVSSRRAHPRTLPTAIRGAYTPLYASPQQVAGEKSDSRDDVHALGVIWYQLLTGNLGLLAVPPDWREVVEEKRLGREFVRLLASCLSSRPENRPVNAGKLMMRLEECRRAGSEGDSPRKAQTVVWSRIPTKLTDEVSEIEMSVPGYWLARPANDPCAVWITVRKTPGPVSLRRGEVYKLRVANAVADNELGGIAILGGLAGLQSLDLSHCQQVTNAGLAHLRKLIELQSLDLTWCDQVTDAGLAHLRDLTGLRELYLWDCEHVTDTGLAHLRGFTRLQSLVLNGCQQVKDGGLAHLKGLTELQSLDLSHCKKVTDLGLCHLRKLTGVQSLNFTWCEQVTDVGLAHLRSLTGLQTLNLTCCKKVTDMGLAELRCHEGLQFLHLRFCNEVTNVGLAHLKELTGLQSLDLSHCKQVTDMGLASLRRAIPNCQISRDVLPNE